MFSIFNLDNSIDDEVIESLGNNFSYLTSLEHLELCCIIA